MVSLCCFVAEWTLEATIDISMCLWEERVRSFIYEVYNDKAPRKRGGWRRNVEYQKELEPCDGTSRAEWTEAVNHLLIYDDILMTGCCKEE